MCDAMLMQMTMSFRFQTRKQCIVVEEESLLG